MSKRRLIALLAGAAVFLSAGVMGFQNFQVPELGLSEGKFKPLKSSPNGVSTQAQDPSKLVEILPFKEDTETTMKAIKVVLDSYAGEYQVVAESSDYLRVVFITPGMRFRDDAEFWLDEKDRVVHFRSQSRVGHSDLGLNRARYEELRHSYLELQM